jgi:hypothetical protein
VSLQEAAANNFPHSAADRVDGEFQLWQPDAFPERESCNTVFGYRNILPRYAQKNNLVTTLTESHLAYSLLVRVR